MAYTPFEWADGEAGGTPITAERLNHIEQGLNNAADVADGKADPGDIPTSPGDIGAAAASHTHSIAQVDGLQSALDGKQDSGNYAPANHTHTISEVDGLQDALDGKQESGDYATASALADLVARVEALENAVE